jgi:3-oxoacyl-[acyl-carrier protein] reductase
VTLAGQVCVVTGASRGLGRAIAEHLAGCGATLALCARTASDLEAVASSIHATYASDVIAVPLDITDDAAVRQFAKRVGDHFGHVDAVVNNAGLLGPVGRIDTVDLVEWRRAFAANTIGVVHVTAAFVPLMTRGGTILNLSGGGIGGPAIASHISSYTTSKGAIAVLTETLAAELDALKIRVNAIAPGALPTELMRPVIRAGAGRAGSKLYATTQRIYENAPSDELIMLDDRFCALIDFMLSSESANLTGRLVSARWDSIEDLRRLIESPTSSLFTLRRIDNVLFSERDE